LLLYARDGYQNGTYIYVAVTGKAEKSRCLQRRARNRRVTAWRMRHVAWVVHLSKKYMPTLGAFKVNRWYPNDAWLAAGDVMSRG
jgi:hypothetical protein